jgi:hypothetical protein
MMLLLALIRFFVLPIIHMNQYKGQEKMALVIILLRRGKVIFWGMQRFLSFLLQKWKLLLEGDPICLNLDTICLLFQIHLMALLEHIHPTMVNTNILIRDIILLPLLANLFLHRVKKVQEENFIHPIMGSTLPLMLLVHIRTIEGITKGKDMPCLLVNVLG